MLFLGLFFAHLVGDFLFQSSRMARDKRAWNRAMKQHGAIHLGLSFLVFLLAPWPSHGILRILGTVFWPVVLTVVHVTVDALKVWVDRRWATQADRRCFVTFVTDQFLHIVVIAFLAVSLSGTRGGFFAVVLNTIWVLWNGTPIAMTPAEHWLAILGIFVLATKASGIAVGTLAAPAPKPGHILVENKVTETISGDAGSATAQMDRKEERIYLTTGEASPERGMLIGYLERLLVMCFVYGHAYPAIGFIVAAKSLVRFKQMDHRDWAEYFLIGTLASMMLGLLWGHLLHSLA